MELKTKYALYLTSCALTALVCYRLLEEAPPVQGDSLTLAALPTEIESFRFPDDKAEEKPWRFFTPDTLKHTPAFWVDAELLFWQPNEGSLSYGVKSQSSTTIQHGRVKNPDFEWGFGFRTGIGYQLPHDKWDLFANYTRLDAHAHGRSGGFVFPTWARPTSDDTALYADSAQTHWRALVNVGDVELGRTCRAGKWLSLRPFIGVRGLWIDQDMHVQYKGGTLAPFDQDHVALDSDFWGVGVRMGVNSLWGLGSGFSFYGNGSASLISGTFDIHELERLQHVDLQRFNITSDVSTVVADADLAFGVQWDYLFSNDRYHFGFKFGWEFDFFFDQNRLFNFLGPNPGAVHFCNEDLSFQGVTLGFRLDF